MTRGATRASSIVDAAPQSARRRVRWPSARREACARERFLWKHVAKRWEDHFLGKVFKFIRA